MKKVDSSVDCHAAQSTARNDGKEALYKQDSRDCGGGCGFSPPAKDSRIFDEFCVLREKAQGSYLSGNDRRAFLTLAQKSQKAESTSEIK